jgi:pentatricopeptide repeat protein
MPVARALLDLRDVESHNALLNYCDRLLEAGLWDDAKAIWDGMARRGLVPANEPGNLLTNPLFRTLPSGRGFDWKLFSTPDVALTPADPELGFAVDFSGDQPEACPLIRQIVPVPEESLTFGMEYRTSNASDNGVNVAVEDAVAGEAAEPLAEAGMEPSLDWTVLRLPIPRAKSRFVCLAVRFRRKPGTVRYTGRVEFRRLRLSGHSDGR